MEKSNNFVLELKEKYFITYILAELRTEKKVF